MPEITGKVADEIEEEIEDRQPLVEAAIVTINESGSPTLDVKVYWNDDIVITEDGLVDLPEKVRGFERGTAIKVSTEGATSVVYHPILEQDRIEDRINEIDEAIDLFREGQNEIDYKIQDLKREREKLQEKIDHGTTQESSDE